MFAIGWSNFASLFLITILGALSRFPLSVFDPFHWYIKQPFLCRDKRTKEIANIARLFPHTNCHVSHYRVKHYHWTSDLSVWTITSQAREGPPTPFGYIMDLPFPGVSFADIYENGDIVTNMTQLRPTWGYWCRCPTISRLAIEPHYQPSVIPP